MSSQSPSASDLLPDTESEAASTPGNDSESSSYETVTDGIETDDQLLSVGEEIEDEFDEYEYEGYVDQEAEDDEDDEGTPYIDAEDILDALIEAGDADHAEATTEDQGSNEQANADSDPPAGQPLTISRHELLQLLSQTGAFRRIFRTQQRSHIVSVDDDEEDDDQDGTYGSLRTRRRKQGRTPDEFPKVPSDIGRELMESGVFGTNEREQGQYERKKKLSARIMRRELALDSPGKQRSCNKLASQSLIPSSCADTIIHYDEPCYSGQFSDDGNFFFSCSKDFHVRMYDTSNPYNWRYYKTVVYPYGQWTITDATLSPDNKFLAYSSIRPVVCLAYTDPDQQSEPYNLDLSHVNRSAGYHYGQFGIWSLRFSGDGREIVAGTSDHSVYVYDIETRQSVLRISGHEEDVNAVCFGDKSSPHLLYSGSDDTTLKVWDRRSLGDSREAGVFLGHTEGITYVDSKGDGRYVLSNGKDQTMKLWDLRKMVPTEKAERLDLNRFTTGFDYRFPPYDDSNYTRHPHDCSLVTFRGHSVLKTLIRCHFSPPGSTDSRYVYTGSQDGSVYIYNLDATLAGKIDVQAATQNSRPRGNAESDLMSYAHRREGGRWTTCVRDASWHPSAPVIAATSWNGYGMLNGTCTVHTWNDGVDDDEAEPRMGQRVGPRLQLDARLYQDAGGTIGGRRSYRATRMRG